MTTKRDIAKNIFFPILVTVVFCFALGGWLNCAKKHKELPKPAKVTFYEELYQEEVEENRDLRALITTQRLIIQILASDNKLTDKQKNCIREELRPSSLEPFRLSSDMFIQDLSDCR